MKAVVVAQLAEQSLDVCSSNPVIVKIYIEYLLSVNCFEQKTKIKTKEAVQGPFKNRYLIFSKVKHL